MVYFESVASYPTKTVYEAGEDLDISGLSVNVRSGGTCTEEYFSIRRFKITDEMGRSVNGDEFNTLGYIALRGGQSNERKKYIRCS